MILFSRRSNPPRPLLQSIQFLPEIVPFPAKIVDLAVCLIALLEEHVPLDR